MAHSTIRVGIVGLGANTRLRHVPGLLACDNVQIAAVCNRRRESTAAAAREFGIQKTYESWQDLVAAPDLDAVVIGAWPYLHCPVTLAALDAGKHVLTEARMAMNAAEAQRMYEASLARPDLICQIVPSPFGMRAHRAMVERIEKGYLGELREVVVIGAGDMWANEETPLAWRQVHELSGLNMLTLGILHETLIRWVPDPVQVFAQAHAFIPERLDPTAGVRRRVGTPDSVHALARLACGARAIYHFSGVTHFGPGSQIHLYGSEGTLKYELQPHDRLWGARRGDAALQEIVVPPEQETSWRVEAEFVGAIRGQEQVHWTDFATGVRYMQFTEAVARSAISGRAVNLPLESADDDASIDSNSSERDSGEKGVNGGEAGEWQEPSSAGEPLAKPR